jgi:hypothetical protein
MSPSRQTQVIKYWEVWRVIFNVLLIGSAWVGWEISNSFNVAIDKIHSARITDPGVLWHFLGIFAVCNLAFSLGYAAEFMGMAKQLRRLWPMLIRPLLLISICPIGMWDMSEQAGKIAQEAAYTKAGVFGYGAGKHP